ATHAHVLAKMPDSKEVTRAWVGLAKKHAWFLARDRGWKGQMWGKRSKATPVGDRAHHENTFHYITRHKNEGAWVWTFRDPPPEPSPHFAKCGLGKAGPGKGRLGVSPTIAPMLPLPQLLAELVRRPSVNPMGRTDLPPDLLHESRVTALLEHEVRNIGCEFR